MNRLCLLPALLALAACATTPSGAPATSGAPADAPAVAQAATPFSTAAPHTHDPAQRASSPRPASPVVVPLDAAARATLPREAVSATAHGETLRCEGVPLVALLRATGAMPAEPLRRGDIDRFVQVDARDGYRAVFSLAELDPTLGANPVFLVDRCDGAALPDTHGPLRLVAPRESRPARWVRQVKSITVIVAP